MRILPYNVIPIFLSRQSASDGALLRYFDVFYKNPPVVGFHVIGCTDQFGVAGFHVTGCTDQFGVVGFHVIGCTDRFGVAGFLVEEDSST